MPLQTMDRTAWMVVVAGAVVLTLAFGLRSSMGLFVAPISETNSWGRDVVGLALAIQNLSWGVVAILAGGLADRFGNTAVIIGGALVYTAGLWITADVTHPGLLYAGTGLLVGAGVAGTGFGIVLPLMVKAVEEDNRQWVMGVGTAAGSLGQFVMAPLAQQFIAWFGWGGALHVMGWMAISMVLLAMPVARLVKAPDMNELALEGAETMRATAAQAGRHLSYWLLTAGFFVCGFHLAFITVHMPGYLTDQGFDASVAAWSIALMGLFNIAGSMAAGVLSGRFSKRRVLILIYGGRGLAMALFLMVPISHVSLYLFSCVIGLLWLATVPPTTGLVAAMFGTRYMATLYGVVFLGHQIGSFSGVWLGGRIYETTGSYDSVWWAGVALSLVAMALHWPIRETRAPALPA